MLSRGITYYNTSMSIPTASIWGNTCTHFIIIQGFCQGLLRQQRRDCSLCWYLKLISLQANIPLLSHPSFKCYGGVLRRIMIALCTWLPGKVSYWQANFEEANYWNHKISYRFGCKCVDVRDLSNSTNWNRSSLTTTDIHSYLVALVDSYPKERRL